MLRYGWIPLVLIVVGVLIATGTTKAQDAAAAPVTFSRDVLPILQKNCQSCHRPGQIAPMSLLTYEQVRPWARAIKLRVVAREMPRWFADPQHGSFANDRSLAQAFFRRALFAEHPYGRSALGTVRGIESLTEEDVRAFYARHVTQANAVIGFAGEPLPKSAEPTVRFGCAKFG